MSPLSTVDVDFAETGPAPRQPGDGASFEHPHTLLQDLREDFSVDFTDNYRRLMGLEGTGQLPAVSAIGMPFDCFTDGDQATRAEPPPSSAMPSHGHMDQVADGNGTSKRTVQSGGTVAGRASHGVGSSVPMGQLQGSHVQSGLPGRVRHPGYRRTPGAIAGAGPPGGQGVQGGLLSLQLADAGAAPGDTVSPSSFCNGRATHPSRTERTGYPSDVSSPWLSPASSGGVGSPPQ